MARSLSQAPLPDPRRGIRGLEQVRRRPLLVDEPCRAGARDQDGPSWPSEGAEAGTKGIGGELHPRKREGHGLHGVVAIGGSGGVSAARLPSVVRSPGQTRVDAGLIDGSQHMAVGEGVPSPDWSRRRAPRRAACLRCCECWAQVWVPQPSTPTQNSIMGPPCALCQVMVRVNLAGGMEDPGLSRCQ